MTPAGTSALHEYHRRLVRSARARRRSRGLAGSAGVALALAGLLSVVDPGPAPVGAVVVAVIAAAAAVGARRGVDPDPERWRRGSDGERVTGSALDRLPSSRWAVLHDLPVPGSRANIDHVVIGPTGVWVVDTKTTRARVRARWGRVRFGDHPLDTAPIRWEAEVVGHALETEVRCVVAVHGEGLRRRGARCRGVPVVPADRLIRRVRRGRRVLRRDEIAELAARAEEAFPYPAAPGWGPDE